MTEFRHIDGKESPFLKNKVPSLFFKKEFNFLFYKRILRKMEAQKLIE